MFPHMLSHDFVHQLVGHIIMDPFCLESFLILIVLEFDLVMLSNLISVELRVISNVLRAFF